MKKLLLLSMFAMFLQLVVAQDYKKVQNAFLLGRVEDAKTEIDKIAGDPKAQAKAETYLWKGKVYAAIFKDPALSAKYANAEAEGDAALKKYVSLDPTYALAKEKDGVSAYFDMYSSFIQQGVKGYNEKKWAAAGQSFTKAINYIDLIIANKWVNSDILMDTTSVFYAAICYQNAKQTETAVSYYQRLADAKVSDTGYLDVYRYLAEYYTNEKRDEQLFKKYVSLGKSVFPSKENWEAYELDFLDTYDLATKIAMYDKEDAAGTITENKYMFYGQSFASATSKEDMDSTKKEELNKKASEAFKKAYQKNNQNPIAAFNVGVISYNAFGELDDKVRENIRTVQRINADKPVEKDPKKKAAIEAKFKEQTDPYLKANTVLEKPINDQVDMAIEWLEKSFAIWKNKNDRSNQEKNLLNKTIDWLANLYSFKRDKIRGKDDKAFDAYEAKFKEFDALHGKF